MAACLCLRNVVLTKKWICRGERETRIIWRKRMKFPCWDYATREARIYYRFENGFCQVQFSVRNRSRTLKKQLFECVTKCVNLDYSELITPGAYNRIFPTNIDEGSVCNHFLLKHFLLKIWITIINRTVRLLFWSRFL